MSKLVGFEIKPFTAARIIGKQVIHSMREGVENPVPALWQKICSDGSLESLTNLPQRSTLDPDTVGWMGEYNPSTQEFVYLAGVLTQPGTPVPEGYDYRDLPECEMAVGWIQGTEDGGDLYMGARDHVINAMTEQGYECDFSKGGFELEYYSNDKFIEPVNRGEKTLILGYYSPCKKVREQAK